MDTSSSPEDVRPGQWRFLQNMGVTGRRRMSFLHGFERLLASNDYNNEDLHDPLFGNTRQPFNLLYQAVSTGGYKKLIAATTNRIYALNNSTGNWVVLSDTLGDSTLGDCRDIPWTCAQVRDTIVFTNGVDTPVYYILDQPPDPTTLQSVTTIPDLARIGLTKAKLAVAFRGFIILADVVMDGERVSHRLVWSDINRPLSFVPASGTSAAGYQDLDYGQDILAIMPIGDSILIYTATAIWEAFTTGDEQGFKFKVRYSDPTGAKMLAYPRTLVSIGDRHLFLGRDSIYEYSLYSPAPEPTRLDYLYKVSSTIFSDINRDYCNVHCGGFDALRKTVWFSWGLAGETCPSRSLIIQTEYGVTSFVDFGCSAFCNYGADVRLTFRDWIIQNCLCTESEIESLGIGFEKEGRFCSVQPETTCTNRPTVLLTHKTRVVDGETVEDWESDPDSDSLCALLTDQTSAEICGSEPTCSTAQVFIGACTIDHTLKQFTNVYTREIATVFSACGLWRKDPYRAIIRSGPNSFSDPAREHVLHRLELQADAEGDADITLSCRVGSAYQCADPNTDKCGLIWRGQPDRKIKCQSDKTAAQHLAANTRPSGTIEWPLFIQSRFLYYELTSIVNGENATFSAITLYPENRKD